MTVRFGLLGTGYWAAETQGAALAAHPEVDLAAVWGRDPAKAEVLAQRYGARAYGDLDPLLAEVDAVAIALPPQVQGELALRAARAGCHLLLDKPVALSPTVAAEITAEADRRGLAGVVFFTQRFNPAIDDFLTKTAAAGNTNEAQAVVHASMYAPGSPYAESRWRQEEGGLWDLGPHALSVLVPVLGPVVEVMAMAAPRQTTHLLTRHEGGAVGNLSVTVDAALDARCWQVSFCTEEGWREVPAGERSAVAAFGGAIDRLVAGTRPGAPAEPCGLAFGRDVVAVLSAAQTSVREGRAVAVGAELPRR
ncbi:Gfo/Idh/MocA family oxidoreductase [Lipingzhangella sp. LS1_29]|uniref:Gfo/Idh/MocA family oxidoreductase n=1 Tax=Lipingzhangella rawalii TaxID=2055835 RepID=A0ABU2H975_9ACTN|nr:Gfo/Idh/MocA family oxidoreductase [Lipingzhangella rawalii]MDS1271852.1 Gfo/Idh/MocA family oxidoreductase [Lipingzhangella rawalii]